MKNIFRALIISFLFLSTACVETAVVSAVVASGTYLANRGYIEEYVDRSYDSCWQNMDAYVSKLGEVTYNSKNEGLIKVDFPEGGTGIFRVTKTTERATQINLRCYKYGFPNNALAETHFAGLIEQVQ